MGTYFVRVVGTAGDEHRWPFESREDAETAATGYRAHPSVKSAAVVQVDELDESGPSADVVMAMLHATMKIAERYIACVEQREQLVSAPDVSRDHVHDTDAAGNCRHASCDFNSDQAYEERMWAGDYGIGPIDDAASREFRGIVPTLHKARERRGTPLSELLAKRDAHKIGDDGRCAVAGCDFEAPYMAMAHDIDAARRQFEAFVPALDESRAKRDAPEPSECDRCTFGDRPGERIATHKFNEKPCDHIAAQRLRERFRDSIRTYFDGLTDR